MSKELTPTYAYKDGVSCLERTDIEMHNKAVDASGIRVHRHGVSLELSQEPFREEWVGFGQAVWTGFTAPFTLVGATPTLAILRDPEGELVVEKWSYVRLRPGHGSGDEVFEFCQGGRGCELLQNHLQHTATIYADQRIADYEERREGRSPLHSPSLFKSSAEHLEYLIGKLFEPSDVPEYASIDMRADKPANAARVCEQAAEEVTV